MNKGLFDLSNLESMGDNDVISMNINESDVSSMNMNESNEFENKDPDTNHPEATFDNDALSGNENNVTIPGGIKETPTAKPYDASEVSVPGGDKETPTAKPYDAAAIPVPNKVTLTTDEWNGALTALKKSFKEGVEIMEMLENATIVETSIEDKQQEYVESIIADQLLLAYEEGPVFEAVKREDKADVKELVRSLRPKIADALYDAKIKFYKPNLVARILTGFIPTGITTPNLSAGINQIWNNRLWQVVGACIVEEGNIKDITDALTKKYAEELGKYKVLYAQATPALIDLFRLKFGWKNNKKVYFILIDKKIPKELAEVEEMVVEAERSDDLNKKNK